MSALRRPAAPRVRAHAIAFATALLTLFYLFVITTFVANAIVRLNRPFGRD